MRPVPPGCPLSPKQYESAVLLLEGLTYREIAERLHRTTSTVRTHLHKAYHTLGVKNGNQLVALMQSSGWLDHIDTDYEDFRITAAQSLYLRAFDRWLRDPSDENAREREHMLRAMYYEKRLTPPWEVLGRPRHGPKHR